MRSSPKILFYLRKNRLNKDGKASIMIRLTINDEMSQFAAKLDVEPELWDAKYGRVDGKTAYANRLNATLDNIKAALINHHNEIEKYDTVVTAEKVHQEEKPKETAKRKRSNAVDYETVFLQRNELKARQSVYISKEIHEKVSRTCWTERI